MALNKKQSRFVEQYLIDLNATQAAIRAGYSPAWAQKNATRLTANDGVQALIAAKQAKISEKAEITAEMVVRELAKIGFADIRKAVKWSPNLAEIVIDEQIVATNGVRLIDSDLLDDATAAAIAEISQTTAGIKIKFHDKRAALVDIGRHIGMFNDKLTLGADESFVSALAAIEAARKRGE